MISRLLHAMMVVFTLSHPVHLMGSFRGTLRKLFMIYVCEHTRLSVSIISHETVYAFNDTVIIRGTSTTNYLLESSYLKMVDAADSL